MINTLNEHIYISYNHLYIEEDRNSAILLGYKLSLTKTEYLILKELVKSGKLPISAKDITSRTGLNLSKENLAFHIFNINSKAKAISNRILIKNISKIGYFLSEEM